MDEYHDGKVPHYIYIYILININENKTWCLLCEVIISSKTSKQMTVTT